MSTVTLTAHAPRVSVAPTRLRITPRGRRVLAALAALPLAFAIGLAILGGGTALGSNEQGVPAGAFDSVTVMPGDSLWTIAERVAPGSDPREVVAEISSLNQLQTSSLEVGQRVSIPTGYSDGE